MLAPLLLGAFLPFATAQSSSGPGQPKHAGTGPGTWEIVGETGVSAQQLFLGNEQNVYIIDKTQNNKAQINGHPAWAVEYHIDSNTYRAMDVVTNTFCAGGAPMADGSYVIVGGNNPVTYGGNTTLPGGPDPYKDQDGGLSNRVITPCTDESCQFSYSQIQSRRWYPTLETLDDGSVIIIGGDTYGGYVNNVGENNPTYEFYPSRGPQKDLQILKDTLPANLYPLTWMLPSGKLFLQLNWGTEFFDPDTGVETVLDNIPRAVRTYPASGATAMLPLTPANNYTAKILFCGGTNLQSNQWVANLTMVNIPADQSCVSMSPDASTKWEDEDDLPEGRTMGNFIILPDGTLFLCNGARQGTAGYGTEQWTIGDSYADKPLLNPWIYDASKPKGARFVNAGLKSSTVARMYHSTATLLPDGSVFVAGSSPHPDVVVDTEYPTEYRAERFYPWYYQKVRPNPIGIPKTLSYGGAAFDITLSAEDLLNDGQSALEQTTVMIIRTGYATHAINFGQRAIELETSYTLNSDGSAILHVSQLPPNAALFQPGPAFLFVTVNGVPSVGVAVTIGSGKVGKQPLQAATVLPANSVPNSNAAVDASNGGNSDNGSASLSVNGLMMMATVLVGLVAVGF